MVTEEDSGTDVPRLVGETRHDGADSGVEKKQKKSQRFEPQTLCETADRLRILTTAECVLAAFFGELLKHAAGQIFGTFGVRHTF